MTAVETYSRGMRQRLGIADALVKSPDILILDEPTTSIDPLGVVEILDLLRSLVNERGLAILLSSHLLTQVQSVCDRIGIFAAGRLVGEGTVDPPRQPVRRRRRRRIEVGLELPTPADRARAEKVLARSARRSTAVHAAGRSVRRMAAHRPAGDRGASRPPGDPGRRGRARAAPQLPSARSSRRSTTSTAPRCSGAASPTSRSVAARRAPAGGPRHERDRRPRRPRLRPSATEQAELRKLPGRLADHRRQGIRATTSLSVRFLVAAGRPRPGRRHPALLRVRPDPQRRPVGDERAGGLPRCCSRSAHRTSTSCASTPSWGSWRRCSAWRSPSMRSTANEPRARCPGSCPSRSTATT